MKRQFGLIGYPLSHSFSKKYFNSKFKQLGWNDHHYELYPLENIDLFPNLLKETASLHGLNVTIPYKQSVIPFLDEISDAAKSIGAVNTILIKNGKTKGFNTDVYGFRVSLENSLSKSGSTLPQKALILGTGGASKAVAWVMKQMGIAYQFVSRKKGKGLFIYEELDRQIIAQSQLIINTTPLGMAPNIESSPAIPYNFIDSKHLLFDLVYNPEKTVFLAKGETNGARILNGLEMLHLQAEKAWDIWNN